MNSKQRTQPKVTIDGLEHKIGLNGFVYFFNGIEWIKSSKTKHEVNHSLKMEANRKERAKNSKEYKRKHYEKKRVQNQQKA